MTSHRRVQLLVGELGKFVQQYRRKAHKGHDPNDRHYSTKVETLMKRLSPEELSELLSDDVEAPSQQEEKTEKPSNSYPAAGAVKNRTR